MNISPIEFNWKDSFVEDNHTHYGVGAQTLQKTISDLGIKNTSIVDNSDPNQLSINYNELFMLSVPVVQEHEMEIQSLKSRISQLEAEILRMKGGSA